MARESIQKKISRVRPPRVHITYDVEIGDAIEMKELPFVLGVLADLSGKPEKPLPALKNRKFADIDRDNFNEVMAGATPRATFRVENKLADDDTKMPVDLRFKNLDDFSPEEVVKQVEPLKKLLDIRTQLSGLLAKTDGNDRLNESLQDIISNTEKLHRVGKEAGVETTEDGKAAKGKGEKQ